MLSTKEKFSWLKETIRKLSSVLELESENEIGWLVYEELDIDIRSSISNENLKELESKKLITKEVASNLDRLRDQAIVLINKRVEPKEIRNHKIWKDISTKFKHIYTVISD